MKNRYIICCLDLSKYDGACMKGAILCSELFYQKIKILFYHNIKLDLLKELGDITAERLDIIINKIHKELTNKADELFKGKTPNFEVVVEAKADTSNALVELQKKYNPALWVMGNKYPSDGVGVVPLKILKKSKTPLLLTPKLITDKVNSVVIATKYESRENHMFDFIKEWLSITHFSITTLHVEKLPNSYFPYIERAKPLLEEKLLERAYKKESSFLSDLDQFNVDSSINLVSPNISRSIFEWYHESDADMLILNRSKRPENRLLGEIPEKIIAYQSRKLILIM